ncbi:Hsp26 [Drosophila busckii]|uniref:Hsp26 n=1 Tax=Drosophila busckii TaxID=30019 RepID=A0A0M4ERC2_DROBS|nr:heat shock protein 26 [Drosophila busckii]ALC44992.1 Hsp26 [Drosophila busckii]
MSLSHLLSLADLLQEPRSHDFGHGMHPRQLQTWATPSQQLMANPWQCMHPSCPTSPMANIVARRRNHEMTKRDGGDNWNWPAAQVGKDGFQVCMDVAQFKPSELTVKVVDNSIVVEGKHEEREDNHGYISRHFVRRYALPQGYEADKVASALSSDGVLTVSVPKPQPIEDKSKERVVQIQQVGPAHLNVKENKADDAKDKKATNGGSK